jgi:hypothetical protein
MWQSYDQTDGRAAERSGRSSGDGYQILRTAEIRGGEWEPVPGAGSLTGHPGSDTVPGDSTAAVTAGS